MDPQNYSHKNTHSHSKEDDHPTGHCSHHHEDENSPAAQQQRHQRQVKSAFANYKKDMKQSFDKIFGEQKLPQYFQLVRERKKQKFQQALEANQKFLNSILESTDDNSNGDPFVPDEVTMCHNLSKIRTTVKQFFREWCAQSPEVKDYILLVEKAKKYLKPKDKVLVPGCGLGRLVLQLIQAGFSSQGNQVTYFMLYGSNFILNYTQRKEQYQIYPFIHTLNNHESEQHMFRSIRVPDKLALQVVPEDADFSMAAGEFTEIYQNIRDQFHGLITCFFIDTANNIFQYIDTIYDTLMPGGIWINYGPLLYHFKDMLDQVSIELSWEQVRAYILIKGFIPLEEQQNETTYCHDPLSSYAHIYKISLTIWRKPEKSPTQE